MTEAPRTRKATKAAAQARRLRRLHAMADQLREAGYIVAKAGEVPAGAPLDAQIYATSGLGETYPVAGWTHDGLPLLRGREGGSFEGLQVYLFSVGPRA